VSAERQTWEVEAEAHVLAVAEAQAEFSSNDVWASGLREPENLRWLGPVMARLRAAGVIEKVATGVLSERGHGSRMNGLWRLA